MSRPRKYNKIKVSDLKCRELIDAEYKYARPIAGGAYGQFNKLYFIYFEYRDNYYGKIIPDVNPNNLSVLEGEMRFQTCGTLGGLTTAILNYEGSSNSDGFRFGTFMITK